MDLLKALYKVYAPTGKEWPMVQYILDFLARHIPDAKTIMDSWGNLYIKVERDVRNHDGFPTLCCHLDQAQKIHSEDFEVMEEGGKIFGFSNSRGEKEGLGADDKNGIWVCLNALQKCRCLKVFMAVSEEKGCWGSNRADLSFFKDSLYILEPDCKGGDEIRTVLRGVPCASSDFEKALDVEKYGYTITEGKTSDILPLTLSNVGVSCANIPCGYHNPHKDEEYCDFNELKKCLEFVIHTIETLDKKFPHEFKTETRLWVENNNYKGKTT